jgi:UDP-3-O-[3-hydroxymyristoyl] N-acetylglucosamine deacetylase/3-hydroxyacyl-[acyl-carrier-protein] dehydratase
VVGNTLRYHDECVRHKILDMVGDLAMLGVDLAGHVVAHRSGHELNARLVRKLLASVEKSNHSTRIDGGPRDFAAIRRILPHRYPFLLIDRVLELTPGRRVVAIKNVSCNEPFFQGHWPDRPIMPGVLIVEALAQAAGLMIAEKIDPTGMVALIASIDGVKLRRPVIPGDQLRLEVDGIRIKERSASVQGVARVDGQLAAEAKIKFVMVEADRAA